MDSTRLGNALALAGQAHAGQLRKGTDIPYLSHVLGVASIALAYGADEDQCIAALLHDAIEDGGSAYRQRIFQTLGPRVLGLVEGCTDGEVGENGQKEDWALRKRRYLEHLESAPDDVLLVSAADKLHNAQAILADLKTVGPAVFERFKAGKEGTLWYYQQLAEIFTRRHSSIAAPLAEVVDQLTAEAASS